MAAPASAPARRSAAPPEPPRPAFSRPVFRETFTVHSDGAQKVLRPERGFVRVTSALYAINVILYIIGDAAAADRVETDINARLTDFAARLDAEQKRLALLRTQHGANRRVEYTNPKTLTVTISSPSLARYVALVQALDTFMAEVDSLWMLQVLTSRQKSAATLKWRNELLRIGRFIMDLERRARRSAERTGRTAEVAVATAAAGAVVEDEAGVMTVEADEASIAGDADTDQDASPASDADPRPVPTAPSDLPDPKPRGFNLFR